MTSSYILLNNVGSKHSLLMKFGQFMSYYRKYPNLVRTKKSLFLRVRTIIRIKNVITKKMRTKLGSTKIIFVDSSALIFREPFM